MEGHSCIRTKVLAEDVSSDGMVQCSNSQYPGNEKMCKNTQMNKKKHGTSDIGLIECNNHIKRVSYLLYLYEKKHKEKKRPGAALEISCWAIRCHLSRDVKSA